MQLIHLPTQIGNTLDAEITRSLKNFIEDKEAYADNTWRQLMHVFRTWARWCWDHGYPYLPIEPSHLREYVLFMGTRYSVNSITQHMALLGMLQRQGNLIPANQHPDVIRALKKVRRLAAESGEYTDQAIPFSIHDLRTVAAVWKGSDKLADVRNLAFLTIAYHTLLRLSEVSRLTVRDFTPGKNGMATLFVGRTKTNLSGDGTLKALGRWATEIVLEWIDKSGLSNHPNALLFCPIHRTGKPLITEKPLSTKNIERIFSSAWDAVNDDRETTETGRYQTWTGHSPRVGAAVDMAERGVSLPQIMREGGWKKPETVLRYIRRKEAFTSAMLDIVDE